MPTLEPIGSLTGGTRKGVALAVLAWLALAVTATATVFTAISGSSLQQWLSLFRPILLYWVLWALVAPIVYRIVVYVPFAPRRAGWALLCHLTTLGIFTVTVPLALFGASPVAWLGSEQAARFHRMNLPIYVFIVFACLLLKHYRLARAKERRTAEVTLKASELATELAQARTDALRARIQPHFLFNALNGIAALIETHRNPEAYRATELLGSLLRDTLAGSTATLVPLSAELTFIRRYIELEKLRFGPRLRYSEQIEARCESLLVPSLILLPLVENAIKHGVATSSEPVNVCVRAERTTEGLRVAITDSGPGRLPKRREGNGIGLSTTKRRLSLQYGNAYTLSFGAGEPRGSVVTVQIPAHLSGP